MAIELSKEELEEATLYFEEYVGALKWKFAKSMPQCPHWYAVRWERPDLDHMFMKFGQFIRDYGYKQYFHGHPGMYFNIGPWKYWTMGAPIHPPTAIPRGRNTFILNRSDKHVSYGDQNGY